MKSSLYTTITSKGQITIPLCVRNMFHLSPGNKLEFLPKENYIVVLPVNQSLKSLKGILPKPNKGLSCEEMSSIIKHKAAK